MWMLALETQLKMTGLNIRAVMIDSRNFKHISVPDILSDNITI
jgi:hypothetical protein